MFEAAAEYLGGLKKPRDYEYAPSPSTSGGYATQPFDLQELAIKVSARGVGSPVHVQFRRIVNITITNTDANNALTLNVLDGKASKTYQVGAAASVIFKKLTAQSFYFTGTSTTVFSYACSWPQETDPNTLAEQTALVVTVSGTVNTDVGQGTQVAGNTSIDYAGSAIDPRAIRSLVSTDRPDITVNQTNALAIAATVGGAAIDPRQATLQAGTASVGTVGLNAGTNAIGTVKTSPLATKVNSAFLAPTALPESTAEAIIAAGVGNVTAGSRLSYSISVAPWVSVAAAAEAIAYIALKGHTSAKYYAIAYAGETANGTFDFNETAEAIDMVWRNSSAATGSHAGGYWSASTP